MAVALGTMKIGHMGQQEPWYDGGYYCERGSSGQPHSPCWRKTRSSLPPPPRPLWHSPKLELAKVVSIKYVVLRRNTYNFYIGPVPLPLPPPHLGWSLRQLDLFLSCAEQGGGRLAGWCVQWKPVHVVQS